MNTFAVCLLLSLLILDQVHARHRAGKRKCVAATNAKLEIKKSHSYTRIWWDKGSGAHRDVSIWRPDDPDVDYFPLGDVAMDSYNSPDSSAVMVKELEAGALVEPESLSLIWQDHDSGVDEDVSIFGMNAPTGYTCLGDIAVRSYTELPPKDVFRCVKSEYLTEGIYEFIWNDSGSGASKDVSIYRAAADNTNVRGIGADTFLSFPNYTWPEGRPMVLDSMYTKPFAGN